VSDRPPSPLSDLLAYLGEMGYGELYLRPPAGEEPARAEAAEVLPAPAEPVAVAPPPEEGAAGRRAELAAVAAAASSCTRCRLCEGRKSVVFGAGDPGADLMLVGEGPGAEEDRQGLPFVGPAGALLTRILAAIDRTRDEVYICNVVKCRPPGNRDPQPDEVAACREYLERQIALVRPRAIVALGRVAAQALLGSDQPIGRLRGTWHRVQGVDTRVTYHPAALLRNPALKRPT
jgi:uracil-DNA glycosylase